MNQTASQVGKTGKLELVFDLKNGKTILSDVYFETPFKITRPYYGRDPSTAFLILMQNTPGIFAGDVLNIKITVNSGAKIWITSQGASKIHPKPKAPAAIQMLEFNIASDAELLFYNDPLIPFKDSYFHQKWKIALQEGSRFYAWDSFTSGRSMTGERWQFKEFQNETKLLCDNKIKFLERYLLQPDKTFLTQHFLMQKFNYLGTAISHDSNISESILEELHGKMIKDEKLSLSGVDMPEKSLLIGKVQAENGVVFKQLQQTWFCTLFRLLNREFYDFRRF
ncbi:MAG: urease accessory protein [bacterium]|jgi:urease accessory protein